MVLVIDMSSDELDSLDGKRCFAAWILDISRHFGCQMELLIELGDAETIKKW